MIRSFEIRDIPLLHRYRQRGLFLDNIPTLTWGRTLVPAGAVLSPISAAMGIFTSIGLDDDQETESIVGQVAHLASSPFARFTFIAPDTGIGSPIFTPLVEHLIKRVGERGAENLIAEVEEKSHTFSAMRRAHFSIYTRQRIWQINEFLEIPPEKTPWQPATSNDEFNIQRLYNAVVPALVQQVEPAPWGRLRGWTLYQEGELLAYVDLALGPRGIWVQPFIHPDLDHIDQHLKQLVTLLQPRVQRPLYFCLRSYQSWLSVPLDDLGAEPGPNQAVMVKRLTASIKKPELSPISAIQANTEPTAFFTKSDISTKEKSLQ